MTREELHAAFDADWESVGFLTRSHEEARRAGGHAALDRFWDEQQRDPARPSAVEQEFSVLLGRDRVRGRYDRVDATADRRGDDHRLQVERRARPGHRQPARPRVAPAVLYALAYEAQHGRLPTELSLHFLESGLVGRSTPVRSAGCEGSRSGHHRCLGNPRRPLRGHAERHALRVLPVSRDLPGRRAIMSRARSAAR